MRILIIILTFIFLLNFSLAEEFNFKIINSPLGSTKNIGNIQSFADTCLAVSQHDLSIPAKVWTKTPFYTVFISTNKGKNWKGNKNYFVFRRSKYYVNKFNELLVAPMYSFNFLGSAAIFRTRDKGLTWENRSWLYTDPLFDDVGNAYVCEFSDGSLFFRSNYPSWGFKYENPDISGDLFKYSEVDLLYRPSFAKNINSDILYYSNLCNLPCDEYMRHYFCYLTGKGVDFSCPSRTTLNRLAFSLLSVDDNNTIYGYNDSTANTSLGIYRSQDSGYTWVLVKEYTKPVLSLETFDKYIFLGTSDGMEYSTDKGETWDSIPLPIISGTDKSVRSVTVSETGWIYGVYGNTQLIRGKIGEQEPEPEEPKPITITPNPAIDYIEIKNAKSTDIIEIYDLLGQLILTAKAVNRIDISNFTNGVYYVRVGEVTAKILKIK